MKPEDRSSAVERRSENLKLQTKWEIDQVDDGRLFVTKMLTTVTCFNLIILTVWSVIHGDPAIVDKLIGLSGGLLGLMGWYYYKNEREKEP